MLIFTTTSLKRFWKILLRTFIVLLLLLLTVWLLIQTKPVQNWLVQQATQRLSKELQTKVEIKHVDFSLFNRVFLEGLLVQDRKKDTLLYAGALKVRITDWFFLKDKAVLHYVGLEDASIKMVRTDSVWNYQFLADYFSSPGTSKKKQGGIEWALEKIHFTNIRLLKADHWRGEDLTAKISDLRLDADNLNFSKNQLLVNTIELDQPFFSIYDYDGNRPPLTDISTTTSLPDSAEAWNTAGWDIRVKDIVIKNGTFKSDRQTERPPLDYFDGKHISFEAINATFKNLGLQQDTIHALINIATKERSGLIVKKLTADMRFHPQGMLFDSLDIVTNKSHLSHYFSMRYKHFNEDMADFMHKVTLDGKFDNSTIYSDDIAFFAPALKTWNKEITLTGNIKGTIDNLGGKGVEAQAGKNTYLNGDFKLAGLPNINETFIDFKANDFRTTYADAATYFPDLRQVDIPRINKINSLKFKGSFTGFIHDFVTFGTIETNLGTVISDLNMKLPQGKAPAYSGNLKTDNFQLGEFLNVAELGRISGDAKLKGSSFKPSQLFAEVNGHLKQIEYNGYNYKDITATGTIDKRLFDGKLTINDSNLTANLNGKITFNKKDPSFAFDAYVATLNLKPLGLTRQDLHFTGNLYTNFTGSNIDNFLGDAHIFNATLTNGEERLPFDSLTVFSSIADSNKLLTVRSNEADISLLGDFTIADLPTAFQVFLNKYYPAYINIPRTIPQNENFHFNVATGNISPFINLFDQNIKGLDNTSISGDINLAHNQLNTVIKVPVFIYKNTVFNDISLTGKGDLQKLLLTGTVGEIAINDSLRLPNTEINIESANNLSQVSIKTSASKAVNAAELSAQVETRKDGFKINFNPSSIVFNDKQWNIEKNGELVLSKTRLDASEVKFSSGEQEIDISTVPASEGTSLHSDVIVNLKKVIVGDFLPLFLNQPKIDGKISGEVRVSDPFNNLQVDGSPTIEQGWMENDSIGLLKTKVGYSQKTGDLTFKVFSDNTDHNFTLDGLFQTKDSVRNRMNLDFDFNGTTLRVLDRYLGTLFGNINGFATGKVSLTGNSASPDIIGKLKIKDGAFKILYTQCTYKFDEATINFQKGAIDFGTIILEDTLNRNHKAKFSGVMYHNFFKDMAFQMNFSSDSILLLNTTLKDNNQFYGKAIGKVSNAYLRGEETDLHMFFNATPTDSSHIILPASVSRESGNADFIVWRQYGREMKASVFNRPGTNLSIEMNLQVNPLAQIDVILDDLTGDMVKAKGRGNINLKVGTKENMSLNGNFEIDNGQYSFNFQTYWKYFFNLTDGNITWNGDPYNAKININARYIAQDVNLSSLTTLSGTSIKEKSNVYINASLTNTLKNPEINFTLDLPENNEYRNDPIVKATFEKYRQDKSEMNKQVASLLLFNTFVGTEQSFVSGSNTSSFLAGTAGQVIFNFVANSLKSLLKKLLKDPNIDPYITLGNSSLSIQNNNLTDVQAAAKFGINYYILNGKIVVKLGSNVDYSSNTALFKNNSNFLFNQDLSIEYLINKEGKLRLVIFNRGNYDLDRGRYARTGVGITYTRDFDLFKELFTDERKKVPALKNTAADK